MNSSHASVRSRSGTISALPSRTCRWTATRGPPPAGRARRRAGYLAHVSGHTQICGACGLGSGGGVTRLPLAAAAAREDIDERRREQDRGDHDVDPLAGHAEQVEAVVDAADDEAAEYAVDGLAPAAEQAGAADDRRGHREQHVAVGGLDDVGGQRHLPRGEQHAGDAGDQAREDEGPGPDGGQADTGSARRLRVAADGVHVAAEAGSLQQDRTGGEHDQDDRDNVGNPLDRPEVGPVDVADGDERDARDRDDDDLDHGQAARREPPGRGGACVRPAARARRRPRRPARPARSSRPPG